MALDQHTIRQRTFKVSTKKQLIIAIQCCIGVYDDETIIHYGDDATYRLKFEGIKPKNNNELVHPLSEYQYRMRLKNLKKKYDKNLNNIIKNTRKIKF